MPQRLVTTQKGSFRFLKVSWHFIMPQRLVVTWGERMLVEKLTSFVLRFGAVLAVNSRSRRQSLLRLIGAHSSSVHSDICGHCSEHSPLSDRCHLFVSTGL